MRKQLPHLFLCTLIYLVTVFAPVSSNAQNATPNAGFEDWTAVNFFGNFFIPNSWDNLDSSTAIINILTCQRTEDAHSGSYAVKLVSYYVNIGTIVDTANGIITTGNLITIPPYGNVGGITYHERPDSISGWFKYAPVGGDSTFIEFSLFAPNGDTIGIALLKIGATISNYTRFSAPVKYFSSETPDLSRWLISSGNGYDAIPGSTLFVDDVSLLFTTGIHEVQSNSGMQLINTMVTNEILLSNPKHLKSKLLLYNTIGALQASLPVENESEHFTLQHLSNGMYSCIVIGDDGSIQLSKKIIVQQ
ncbi:MAG: hypothetical protein IPO83_06700 [Chitinophagaceae bacterium]|nr:hypothetical protein [Chitinophagaceae bacterium]